MPDSETFTPTEIWTPETAEPAFDDVIEKARYDMNSQNPEELISKLNKKVDRSEDGIVYAVLNGNSPDEHRQYSQKDALVMFNPFANTATANMLVRSEFIRLAAKEANVRDEVGRFKPVVMLAAPGLHGSRLKLSKDEKKLVRKGDLGPVAQEYLKTVRGLKFGHIALLGYSQGADLALSGAQEAYSAQLDAGVMSMGDPAGVENRGLKPLAQDFYDAAPDLEARAARSGLAALDKARGVRADYSRFVASMLYPNNWYRIAAALGSNTFEANMQAVIDRGDIDKIVVAYGSRSTISPPRAVEPALARLKGKVRDNRLTSIRVEGGTHAWGEDLTLLAKLYLKALI